MVSLPFWRLVPRPLTRATSAADVLRRRRKHVQGSIDWESAPGAGDREDPDISDLGNRGFFVPGSVIEFFFQLLSWPAWTDYKRNEARVVVWSWLVVLSDVSWGTSHAPHQSALSPCLPPCAACNGHCLFYFTRSPRRATRLSPSTLPSASCAILEASSRRSKYE